MLELPLEVLPRQSFSVVIDGNRWGIRVYEVTGCMACDFTLNDVDIILGVRAVAGSKLLPYKYEQIKAGGNFAFYSDAATRLPWWEDFGSTCGLIYATAQELQANGL